MSINHLKIFEDCNQCKDYIRSIRQIVPQIEQLRQLFSIYIHCLNKNTNQQWAKQFLKVNKSF
jgi:hypothetical protein